MDEVLAGMVIDFKKLTVGASLSYATSPNNRSITWRRIVDLPSHGSPPYVLSVTDTLRCPFLLSLRVYTNFPLYHDDSQNLFQILQCTNVRMVRLTGLNNFQIITVAVGNK